MIFNEDCIHGCQRRDISGRVDLVIADPPYGINFSKEHGTYNRKKENVVGNYRDVPYYRYEEWCDQWMGQIHRILHRDGSAYIFSGWNNLHHILNSINKHNLVMVNHLIWSYQFGVYCSKKYVSSHYHILYVSKPKARRCFNIPSDTKKAYALIQDSFSIKRPYQTGKTKVSTKLPRELVERLISISSNEGDGVVDMFSGSGVVYHTCTRLKRKCMAFEIDRDTFDYSLSEEAKAV